jgi:signal transduction histidine kinase
MERMKHHFISLLGGELQTPISSIRGALSLIAGGMLQERPDMAARLVKIAHDNCEHLVTLIRDILDIDGMAVGRMRFDIEAEPLSRLIAAAVEDAQIRLGAQGVRLAIQPPAEDILVLADAGHLRQVLVSLIAFAGRLAAPGNTLQIGASLRGTTARIAVTESGPGVAPAFHGRSPADELAQPVAPPSGAKDAELSLHVGKLLIEHMGGRMGVDPTPPGSTFWIELPAEIARPQPVRAAG